MSVLPAGTVLRVFNETLGQLERERLRYDEDVIGLALPEPVDGRPGLVVSVFPRSGPRPGGVLIYPARAIVRASLIGSPDLRILHPVAKAQTPVQPLGRFKPATPLPVKDTNTLRSRYMQLLDIAAVSVAVRDRSSQTLHAEIRHAYQVLAAPALRPSYHEFAPAFHAWMGD